MEEISRRSFLASAGALAAGAVVLPGARRAFGQGLAGATGGPTLRQAAESKGLLFGTASQMKVLSSDSAYAAMIAKQCDLLVPEWELKFNAVCPKPNVYDFSKSDWLFNFAQQHDMKYRGHCLIWHNALPTWFNSYVNKGNAEKVMTDWITNAVKHYKGKLQSWDVVNEVIKPEDNTDGIRSGYGGTWYQLLGPDYIEQAFHIAHAADPSAMLVMNENTIEEDNNPKQTARRAALLSWLTRLVKNNVPVNALGIQSHLKGGDPNIGGPQFQQFLSQVSDLGLKIMITEIDVDDSQFPADQAKRDQMVADTYYRYISAVLKQKSAIAVIAWEMDDQYSSLNKEEKRSDGMQVRSMAFDTGLQPKKSYYAIQRALMEASPR